MTLICRATSAQVPESRPRRALQALNFFMADMQAGVAPFLGVFLLEHGWHSGWIGTVMTIGAIAGVAMTAPAGAWVDSSHDKRALVAIPGLCTVFASAILLASQSFWLVALSQVATAIAGAAIVPAVNGITLGIFQQKGFLRQNGLNQAYNHAGNAVGALLSGLVGWKFGLPAVFALAVLFSSASIVSVMMIPKQLVDDRAARGLRENKVAEQASGLKVLLHCSPLQLLAGGPCVVPSRQRRHAAALRNAGVSEQTWQSVRSRGGHHCRRANYHAASGPISRRTAAGPTDAGVSTGERIRAPEPTPQTRGAVGRGRPGWRSCYAGSREQ